MVDTVSTASTVSTREGTVVSGANNIFQVALEDRVLLCRIKGKVLRASESEYNPLAPGDRVEISDAGPEPLIVNRLERRNSIARWNRKRRALQTLAANIDCTVAVASPQLPPFRPRFVDRVLASAELGASDGAIVMNKIDQGVAAECASRLDWYRKLGYPVFEVSALTGEGVVALLGWLAGKTVALVGQSGVGKSTLINLLVPGASQRTGEVSTKYRRGRHVTTVGTAIRDDRFTLIDTPGIREIDLYPHSTTEIAWAFREFRGRECGFSGCTHLHEPDCAVMDAVERGEIEPDRYTSYGNVVTDRNVSAAAAGMT